jgi:hypothetical protein
MEPRSYTDSHGIAGLSRVCLMDRLPYAGSNNSLDSELRFGGREAIGISGIENSLIEIIKELDSRGLSTMPIFLDEFNISPDGTDDPQERGWNALSAALGGNLFCKIARLADNHSLAMIPFQFVEAGGQRLSSIDALTGDYKFPFWRDQILQQMLNTGNKSLQTFSSNAVTDALAIQSQDSLKLSVLVTNLASLKPDDITSIAVNTLFGSAAKRIPKSVSLTTLDTSVDPKTGPKIISLDPSKPIQIAFRGYGLALLEVMF